MFIADIEIIYEPAALTICRKYVMKFRLDRFCWAVLCCKSRKSSLHWYNSNQTTVHRFFFPNHMEQCLALWWYRGRLANQLCSRIFPSKLIKLSTRKATLQYHSYWYVSFWWAVSHVLSRSLFFVALPISTSFNWLF